MDIKKINTARAWVLNLLSDGLWHNTKQINSVYTEGTKRLRELRADGVEIEKRHAGGHLYEYRLIK